MNPTESLVSAAALFLATVAPAQSWVLKETPYAHLLDGPMTYDEARERTVLFDPGLYGGSRATWEWDGTEWARQAPANSPAFDSIPSMAYDSARQRIVLVGANNPPTAQAETWEWDGVNWTQRISTQSPPGASPSDRAMAYDRSRSKTVLFGWPSTAGGETWEWDGTTWTQIVSATVPSLRGDHVMAFDPVRQTTLLFGGDYLQNDTWEWDGVDWAQLNPAQSPPAFQLDSMATDLVRNRVVLYSAGSTWEWDGSTWHPRTGGPTPLGRGALAYDRRRQRTVLACSWAGFCNHGLFLAQTWEWDGNVWVNRNLQRGPLLAVDQRAAFDSARDRLVLVGDVGGCSTTMDTWEWDGWHWARPTLAVSPARRTNFAMAFDAARGSTLLFGGYTTPGFAIPLNDTWTWNGVAWTQHQPAAAPLARSGSALAYDSGRNRVVLFGGYNYLAPAFLSDTWEWDGANWLFRSTAPSPAGRRLHAMAYDVARGRVVLFGGEGSSGWRNDTWEWDGNTWTMMQPASAPTAQIFPSLVYDSPRQQCVLSLTGYFSNGVPIPAETWEWDGVDWTQLYQGTEVIRTTPPVYDTVRNRVVGVSWNGPDLWLFGNVTTADATRSGTPCGGSSGAPQIAPDGRPWLGNLAFGIDLHDLQPSTLAAVVLGLAPATTPVGGGCTLYVDLAQPAATAFLQANPQGFAHLALPIPATAGLLGVNLYGQGATLDPTSSWGGVALTGRLELLLGE